MQLPADAAVRESPLVTEHPAVLGLPTEYDTAPRPLPPLVESNRFVRKVPLVETKVNAL